MANIDDFKKIELKIATIKEVNDHPDADKLYVIIVEVGDHTKQIVAGIKNFYLKEDLIGKQVEITCAGTQVLTTDGKSHYKSNNPIGKTPTKDLEDWFTNNTFKDGTITTTDPKGNSIFTHWFDIEDCSELNKLYKIGLKRVKVDDLVFRTENNKLFVSCDNKAISKGFDDDIAVKSYIDVNNTMDHFYPILTALDGRAEFYYYINSKGVLKLFIRNGAIEFMLRNAPDVKATDKEVKEATE